MTDLDLHEVLSRASDDQDAPEIVVRALAEANRRLARRRAGAAAAVATAVVAGIVLVRPLLGPSPDPVEDPATTQGPDRSGPATPDVANTDPTQPTWDPRSIERAPSRRTNLPSRINLQVAEGPSLLEQAMPGVVAALRDDTSLRLLSTDGTWRILPLEATQGYLVGANDVARPAISSDGTRVAIATEAGIRVIDVTTGTDDTIKWPKVFAQPRDYPPTVVWQPGDDGLVVFDIVRSWLVWLDASSRKAPYRSYTLGIDPDGPVYQNDFQTSTLLTWEGDEVVAESPFIQCERLVAGYGMVACTTGSLQPSRSGPVVIDPATGEIIAYAPIEDPNAIYSDNGGLTLLGFLDDHTLLMLIGPATSQDDDIHEARYLATWEFRTGEFQRISTGDTDLRSIAVAPALVD